MLQHLTKFYVYGVLISVLICTAFYMVNRTSSDKNNNLSPSPTTLLKLFGVSFVANVGGFYLLKHLFSKTLSLSSVPSVANQTIMTGNPTF